MVPPTIQVRQPARRCRGVIRVEPRICGRDVLPDKGLKIERATRSDAIPFEDLQHTA